MLTCLGLALLATACARPSLELPSFKPPWRDPVSSNAPAAAPASLRVLGWPGDAGDDERLRTLLAAWPDGVATLDLADDHGGDYEAALRDVLRGQASADVLFVDAFRLPDLVRDGALLPANGSSAAGQFNDGDDFYPSLRAAFEVDGTPYCLPREARTLALVYRPDLLATAQQRQPEGETLAAPSEAWTWDDLAAAALAMAGVNNEFYTTFGLAVGGDLSRWWPLFYGAGGQFLADDGRSLGVDSEAGLAATSYLVDLVRDGAAVRPATQLDAWAGETLAKGHAVMTIEGNWIVPWLQANYPDMPFAVMPLPAGDAGRASTAFTSCYAVSATTTQPEGAWALVNYLNRRESLLAITESGYAMPARQSLGETWLAQHPNQQPFLNAVDYAQIWQMPAGFRPVVEAGNDALAQSMDGRIPPEDVLTVMESVGDEILSRKP